VAADLRASVKERAENVIVVDLMRNDLGRIAQAGTVAVTRLWTVERYETVLQMTSDVGARLRPGTGLLEVFRALFACGSVTGAPKASTMRIITEVETCPRGGVLRRHRMGGTAHRAGEGPVQRGHPHRGDRPATRHRRLRHRRRHHLGLAAAAEHAELRVKTRILQDRSPDAHVVHPRSGAGYATAGAPRGGNR